jgi:malonyl-CoA O-methyltransferase
MPDSRRLAAIRGVRVGYDRWASVYDHDSNPLQGLEEPIVRGLIGDVGGLEVLDLGCGTGRHSVWLAARGALITAVDFSEGMLAEARRKPGAEAIRFVRHDLHDPLPFESASFDRVVSGLVLEHLEDLGGFFGQARRVLRPGGLAVISTMHPAMFLRGTQAQFTDPSSGERVRPGSLPHQLSDFVMAALRAGFAIRELREDAPDAAFAGRFPRAEKYVGWPMLATMALAP